MAERQTKKRASKAAQADSATSTKTRKRRTTVSKKARDANSKVYLNGNSYSKLSGLYFTSLDYTKAVSEWNALPYLQTMYGAQLCGYSLDPGAAQRMLA